MSDALYHARLRWHNRNGGCAKLGEFVRKLGSPPDLGFSYVELDYRPPVASIVRPYPWSDPRDMIPSEQAACVRYLAN